MGRWWRAARLKTVDNLGIVLAILAVAACGTTTLPSNTERSDAAVADGALPTQLDAGSVADARPVEDGAVDGAVAARCPADTFSDCSPMTRASCTVPPLPAAGDVTWLPNVVYTTPFRGTASAQPQALDLAVPKVARGAPFVVIVHGGGWRGGDKSDHRDDLLRLAGQGYVAAAINYRLVNNGPVPNRAPAAASDTRCAIRWAKAHAASYGADPDRVIAIGASAGANLVALLGTSPNDGDLDTTDGGACETSGTPKPAGIVSYYGRMDLRRAPIPDYLVDYIGRDGDWLGREAANSPALHVSASAPPFLLIHGQADGTVPVEQSRLFHDALDGASVPNALVELPGQDHGFPLFATTPGLLPASCSTLQFLSHFQPEPPVARPQRTVVYVLKETAPGEQIFLRGGHANGLVAAGNAAQAFEPIRYLSTKNATSSLGKQSDLFLDWSSDSLLDWTCDQWPTSYGPKRSYSSDGYGEDPENRWGLHAWKFDVVMDGAPGEWFEFKAVLRHSGAGGAQDSWEPDVNQSGTPFVTGNHWAKKGAITFVRFGESPVTYLPL